MKRYRDDIPLFSRFQGRSVEELQWDLNYLLQLWTAIDGAGKSANGAFLIYQESSLVIRAIRDYFSPDIGEVLIDTDEIYDQAKQFMQHVMPDMMNLVKRYRDDIPLFSRFQARRPASICRLWPWRSRSRSRSSKPWKPTATSSCLMPSLCAPWPPASVAPSRSIPRPPSACCRSPRRR
nr:ribonuclease E/G [Mycobacterium tuberculosis]